MFKRRRFPTEIILTGQSTRAEGRWTSSSPTGATPRRRSGLAKALRRSRNWKPQVINTDKNPAYGEAIVELEKVLPKETQHRQVKYLNNRPPALFPLVREPWATTGNKRLIKPTLGFQSMKTAYATIKALR